MAENTTNTTKTTEKSEAEEKKKPEGFFSAEHPFQRMLTNLFNLMLINLLTLLLMLPIFTAGAAAAAMAASLTKIAEGDEHEVTRSYFNFFRQSFSDATMLYLFYLPLFVIDLAYLALTGLGVISGHAAVTLILMLLSLGFLGSAIYGAMLVSRYVNGSFQTFRNSWLLAIGYLPKTAAALAAFVLTFALIAVTWPYLGALAVLFGLSAPGYFAVKMILPAFKEQEEKQR